MVVDGKGIAADILAAVSASHEGTPVVRAVTFRPTKATESYLTIKAKRARDAGMMLELVSLEDGATTEDAIAAVTAPGADAVIVQMPLPEGIDTQAVLDAIPQSKDADVLSRTACDAFYLGEEGALIPPVALAVREILLCSGVDALGKKAAVIGKGMLVGKPVAALLTREGAIVDTFDKGDGYEERLKEYDIIVSGAGVPNLIQPHLLSEGVVLIDAGTSESAGVLVGDADPRCASIASVFTPVPGGVGPVAVACLFRNVATLVKRT